LEELALTRQWAQVSPAASWENAKAGSFMIGLKLTGGMMPPSDGNGFAFEGGLISDGWLLFQGYRRCGRGFL